MRNSNPLRREARPSPPHFSIQYTGGRLILKKSGLPHDQQQYVEQILQKVDRYKVIGSYQGSPVFSLYQPPPATPAGERALGMRLRRRFHQERIPATATIAINKACQCRCEHCSALYYNHSLKPDLSTAQLKQVLRETVELGVTHIILLGGEPLLRSDLTELIASVPPENAIVTLFTNGELLTSKYCRELQEAGLMGAFVSLDSVQEEEHDRLRRRPGLFKRALEGISNLQEAQVLVAISSYLSPERVQNGVFRSMMDLGKELRVNEVTFFDAIPTGQWLKDTSCLLTSEDRLRIQTLVAIYRGRSDYPGLSAQSTLTSECGSAFCFAANTQFYLTAHGEMCPCDFTPLTIGRFPEQSLGDLWKKMTHTPPYHQRARSCRMQDPWFRKTYIDPLPLCGPMPFPLPRLPA